MIIGIALFVLGLVLFFCGLNKNGDAAAQGFLGMFVLLIGFALILGEMGAFDRIGPSAIDVYRGRTDIQITYKVVNNDTVDIDSTVVWKDEFKLKEDI